MVIDPKPLTDGWIKRCFINAIKLSMRSPLMWMLIFVCLPILTYFIPFLPLTTFIAGFIVLSGTLLCFANDHLVNYRLRHFIGLLFLKPQPIIFICVSPLAVLLVFGHQAMFLHFTGPLDALFKFGITAVLSLMVSCLLAPLMILMFFDVPRGLYEMIKAKRNGSETNFDISINGTFEIFALHLITDTKLTWYDACQMSKRAKDVLKLKDRIILFLPLYLVLICPVALWIGVPFFYMVYREIFFQEGLTDTKTKRIQNLAYE